MYLHLSVTLLERFPAPTSTGISLTMGFFFAEVFMLVTK